MEKRTPREAVDALVASTRSTLQTVGDVQVFGSGSGIGGLLALTITSPDAPPGHVVLRRSDRVPFLQLRVALQYSVVATVSAPSRHSYLAVVATYMYRVADLDGRELFAYHLHPHSLSPVESPHLHFRSARPMQLPIPMSNAPTHELALGHAHFPTHRIELAELIRFLITDLGVAPRRSDWEAILSQR